MSSPPSFTVVSTFSGCGGSSLGYQLAGGKVLLAVEWDDNAVATYRLNFPSTPIYHGDIAKLSVDECCKLAGIGPGELDILDGSPPCQGFSTAGKRDFGDDRNRLFREFVRLLRGLQPKVFVMENVSGMVKGKMKLIFAECLRELKASGYRVKARVLNAMYFNVPQSRQRLIFVGVGEDLGVEPGHPKGKTRPMTVRQAIGKLPNDGPVAMASCGEALKRMSPGANNGGGKFLPHTYGLCRLAWDAPSPTLIKEPGRHAHPDGLRYLSLDAAKQLASFPPSWQTAGTYNEAWARIGNSVPPDFMRAIAEYIRDNILHPEAS